VTAAKDQMNRKTKTPPQGRSFYRETQRLFNSPGSYRRMPFGFATAYAGILPRGGVAASAVHAGKTSRAGD